LLRKTHGFVLPLKPFGEFWNASTRRDRNGFGLSTAETDRMARVIERDFEFLSDSRDVHDRWRQLLIAHDAAVLRAQW